MIKEENKRLDTKVLSIFSTLNVSCKTDMPKGGDNVNFETIFGDVTSSQTAAFPILKLALSKGDPGGLENETQQNLLGQISNGVSPQTLGISAALRLNRFMDSANSRLGIEGFLNELSIDTGGQPVSEGDKDRAGNRVLLSKDMKSGFDVGTGGGTAFNVDKGVWFVDGDKLKTTLGDRGDGVSKGEVLESLLAKLSMGTGDGVSRGEVLESLLAKLSTGTGDGVSRGEVLESLLAKLSTGTGDGASREEVLESLLAKLSTGTGDGVSRGEILESLLAKLGAGTGRRAGDGVAERVRSLDGDRLKAVLSDVGERDKSFNVVQGNSAHPVSKDDMLKALLADPYTATQKPLAATQKPSVLKNDYSNYGANANKESTVGEILARVGMDPEGARIVISGETPNQSGRLGNGSGHVRLDPIQEVIDLPNDKSPVDRPREDKSFDYTQGRVASKTVINDRVLDQIVGKVSTSVNNGRNEIIIHLKPDFLGSIHLKISIEDHHVLARILTENPVTKEIIEANSHQLKLSLLEHGLKVDRFSVFVGHDQGQFDQGYENPSSGRRWVEDDPDGGKELVGLEGEDTGQPGRITGGQGQIDFFA